MVMGVAAPLGQLRLSKSRRVELEREIMCTFFLPPTRVREPGVHPEPDGRAAVPVKQFRSFTSTNSCNLRYMIVAGPKSSVKTELGAEVLR
jgi:hypothetical protein